MCSGIARRASRCTLLYCSFYGSRGYCGYCVYFVLCVCSGQGVGGRRYALSGPPEPRSPAFAARVSTPAAAIPARRRRLTMLCLSGSTNSYFWLFGMCRRCPCGSDAKQPLPVSDMPTPRCKGLREQPPERSERSERSEALTIHDADHTLQGVA